MKCKSFAEAALFFLKGKYVEVYEGTNGKLQKWSDYENQQKEVIRGILVGGMGDLLIVEVTDISSGLVNNVYINGWAIRTILEPKNSMSTFDVYSGEEEKQPK